jgi:hypothetical protein
VSCRARPSAGEFYEARSEADLKDQARKIGIRIFHQAQGCDYCLSRDRIGEIVVESTSESSFDVVIDLADAKHLFILLAGRFNRATI